MKTPSRLLGTLLLTWAAAAGAGAWTADPAGSRLEIVVTYEGEPVSALFRRFDARMRFDPRHPEAGELRVPVEVTSLDFDSADVNEAVREPEWLDVARFPQAEFRSTDIRATGPGAYLAHGTLRLKGVRREVAVPFHWLGSAETATLEGELRLDRAAFGIGTGEWASGDAIGLEVAVRFRVTLRPAGGEGEAPPRP
jgi:polyisoprenoid-binding protein YceI